MWEWTYNSKLARDAWDLLNITGWLAAGLILSVTYAINMIGLATVGGWFRFAGVILPPIGALIGFVDIFNAIYRV
jgi:hypothetical protein